MLTLGICCGWDAANPPDDVNGGFRMDIWQHDSAAVLLQDGQVLAASEEERLSRVKHSGHRATRAIQFCCESAGIRLSDIDQIAYYANEKNYDLTIGFQSLSRPATKPFRSSARELIQELFHKDFGESIDIDRIRFFDHHYCHAASSFYMSGFEEALVVTLDGEGDNLAGSVFDGRYPNLNCLHEIPFSNSLGNFYIQVIRFLGYRPCDEYKVMGLAPYGDPSTYRSLMREFYSFLKNGKYVIHSEKLPLLLGLCTPRRQGEEFTQIHKDIAASLQEMLENIALHLITYYQDTSGHSKLCLAGGVAQNCSMNGVIQRSGQFDDIFICPASHDAGCALGAAFAAQLSERPESRPERRLDVFWGTDVNEPALGEVLDKWRPLISFDEQPDVVKTAASLLAEQSVIGWVQGRSEFGPRALGNRSILADPRPSENKKIINSMIKKRENYRPFAPSVLAESGHQYFAIEEGSSYPHMTIVVKVREEYQQLLGAVTHVDGTARLQTVEKAFNPKYWSLIKAFEQLTDVPILLNTSFNNNVEPIVDSADDAIVCFLTTGLHYLFIGDYLIRRSEHSLENYLQLTVSVPRHLQISAVTAYSEEHDDFRQKYLISNGYSDKFYVRTDALVSAEVYHLLNDPNDDETLKQRFQKRGWNEAAAYQPVIEELIDLWHRRLIVLSPR